MVVSATDVTSGRYGICDVVLPLPGSSIVYPDNDIKQVACPCLGPQPPVNLSRALPFYSVSAMMLMACMPVPTALAPVQAAPVLRHNGLLSCLTAGTAALACSHGFRHVTQFLC